MHACVYFELNEVLSVFDNFLLNFSGRERLNLGKPCMCFALIEEKIVMLNIHWTVLDLLT